MRNNINNMNEEELKMFLDKRMATLDQLINQYIKLIKEKTKKNKFKSMKQKAYYINNIYNYVSWVNEQIKMNDNVSRDTKVIPRRGEIWTCELGQNIGSEENKIRPVIIIQNDTGNKNAPTTIIAPISNRPKKIAVHIELRENDYKLENGEKNHITGTVLLEQIKVVSKARLGRHIATLNKDFMEILDSKIKISLNL
ncbi:MULTISPECIES: type II toxin-antitoxin system PemK/MazF family toxin [Clostridium]|uniref:PemK family of DNA-binding proteins n=2 Tax=Clostridium novyi TaxID=1542 RepID=A0Q3B1_CLONN|nr:MULTISPECIES: type II toxin-antitoxin system PemK/MazF family toxin [Clostridium]ABK62571.1 pemK family of DNA-binding proteins [Clostridium novyi NT]KEH86565.1 growth inhibitor PemK [Clostridium novyi A str. 4540]KEH87369.1 growth inhibitor PemK [Clostridium novyi A str. BKT29909]KEH87569.1 growth inhibitor PemK [Clostridium novyi A str. NCTC 538]KEH90905.1 growth inhibitor PemK [Clostridium botulinum C/D str. It1]